MRVLLPHELCDDIYAAGRCADEEDKSVAEALYHAADDAGEHRVVRQGYAGHGEDIDKRRGEHRPREGADEKRQAEVFPCDEKQRHVHNDGHHTDGEAGEMVDDHRNAGHAAGDDVVRVHEKLEAHRVYGGADENYQILDDTFERLVLRQAAYSCHSCINPRS